MRAWIALGSNVGSRLETLRRGLDALAAAGIAITAVSSLYETPAVGPGDQPPYLNAVARVSTELSARTLLEQLQAVEASLGRVRTIRWGPRTLDLDLIFYGDQRIVEPDLVVPHPRWAERIFVVAPLAELDPDFPAPDGRTVAAVLVALQAPALVPVRSHWYPGGHH